jgi:hypothetical protein
VLAAYRTLEAELDGAAAKGSLDALKPLLRALPRAS